MAQYNIEMNSYDGSQYNQLYPQTLLNNITDWAQNIYNKSETNDQINTIINQTVPSLVSNSFDYGWRNGTGTDSFTLNFSIYPRIVFYSGPPASGSDSVTIIFLRKSDTSCVAAVGSHFVTYNLDWKTSSLIAQGAGNYDLNVNGQRYYYFAM